MNLAARPAGAGRDTQPAEKSERQNEAQTLLELSQ